ncbi:hypothetical protein DFR50_13845 [Roseiarcus fermentans]|uniref:General secretion pathway protein N n=1 Tax=Roseiarcus fermentans TaxID=1473586 RepID=A0A366EQL0_9HYPH|nr:hypothetical protein [Roseiarcus fermentans]RBP04661.1 hypothetical protein DFR50_13845 [Roseiarcus fermentans]
MARAAVRRLPAAAAIAGLLAGLAGGVARAGDVSLAAIETDSGDRGANSALQSEGGAPEPEPAATGNPLWAIPISKLSATRERPLFSVSRRPQTPAAPAAPAAPAPTPTLVARPAAPETPPLTLVGTIIGAGSRIAILYDESSKIASGVREGERASGWTLRSVDPRSATLEGNGRMVTLDLPEPAAQPSPKPSLSTPQRRRRLHEGSDGL